ncbi:MAG: type II CRISPR RNA-guided endonuclease Cas9 [Pseudomonadota bacterium]
MHYRIGIDLGTNSLGWAAIQLLEPLPGTFEAGPLLDLGVRIFSDARNPKDKSSNAAQRRGPRGMRRNRDRRLARGRAMLHALVSAGLMPKDDQGQKALEALDPWILRAEAPDRKLEPYEIGRALFHLQQRRGFKSNRKTDGDEDSAMYDAIEAARSKMAMQNARTLGELFGRPRKETLEANKTARKGSGQPMPQARVKAQMNGSKMAYDYYPDRTMILDEFDQIWAEQARHHPSLLTDEARQSIRRVIEHQRPLKPQKAGKCTFLPNLERAPKALPSAHYVRVLQEVNNLKVGAVGETQRSLTPDESKQLVDLLMQPSSKMARRTFKQIRKTLRLPDSQVFNLETRKRDHLLGDETAGRMMQELAWGPDWLKLARKVQDEIVQSLLETEENKEVIDWLMQNHGLDEARAIAVSKVRLPDQHGRLSLEAINRLIPLLEQGQRYDEAATALFKDHRARGDGEIHEDSLPYYGEVLTRHTAFEKDPPQGGKDTRNDEERFGRVANPTVHVALNELRKVINDLIKRWGPPEEVVLELARNLPLSDRGLRELESTQKKNQDLNDKRRKELEALKVANTYENRMKLRLYEEALDCFGGTALCVFTGETISMAALFTGEVEIEHILPLSRTWDDSFSNKVLSKRAANRPKKNQSPFEAFGHNPTGFDWEMISQRATELPKAKSWRFAPDAMDQWEARGGDFIARQLNDTRYISRLGKTFVEALYGGQGEKGERRRVWVVPGRLTSDLRYFAGFNTLSGFTDLNRKDRTDHRHHAVDALIIALTDQAMLKRSVDLAKREEAADQSEILQAMAEPLKRYRRAAEDRLSKLVVSHKPDHGFQDGMHNDTAYGITGEEDERGQALLVTRKPIEALDQKDIVNIVDYELRRHFAYATEGLSGAAFQEAMRNAAAKLSPPVNKLRLTTPMKPTSFVTIRHGKRGEHAKAYKGDGNYCYDIFMGAKGKWDGEVITTFEAYQRARKDKNWWQTMQRDDGTPLIMRIRKGDMLEIDGENGSRQQVYVYQFSKGKINMAQAHEADASARVKKGELRRIQMSPSSLQKANAVRLSVSPSGKVKRHKA